MSFEAGAQNSTIISAPAPAKKPSIVPKVEFTQIRSEKKVEECNFFLK